MPWGEEIEVLEYKELYSSKEKTAYSNDGQTYTWKYGGAVEELERNLQQKEKFYGDTGYYKETLALRDCELIEEHKRLLLQEIKRSKPFKPYYSEEDNRWHYKPQEA